MLKKQIAQEYPPADEFDRMQDLVARLKARVAKTYPNGLMRRDAHPKMHAVVKAEFIVEPDLPDVLRVGVFREARSYQAWIRFSNQNTNVQSDRKGDIRGMAIKLMGVPGEKILAQEQDEQTQDFVLISTNVFITKDVAQFDALIKAMSAGILAMAWFFLTNWRAAWNLCKAMKKCATPLQLRYWSTTPYLFGQNAVKYSAIPPSQTQGRLPANPGNDFLREAIACQLAQTGITFDFAVQLQTDADTMPIEDPGTAWNENTSPFRKLATIRIFQQECDSEQQRTFGENLSFSPWHSLPEHRPLGGINRARRVVYETISSFRHQHNQIKPCEPQDWNIP